MVTITFVTIFDGVLFLFKLIVCAAAAILSSCVICLYDDKLDNDEVFVIAVGFIKTGVDKMSRSFFGAPELVASFRFFMDGIVNDCSIASAVDELCGSDCDVKPAPANVDWTKFVEFRKIRVKLLVLNDNNPFDDDDDEEVGGGGGSALSRLDFAF